MLERPKGPNAGPWAVWKPGTPGSLPPGCTHSPRSAAVPGAALLCCCWAGPSGGCGCLSLLRGCFWSPSRRTEEVYRPSPREEARSFAKRGVRRGPKGSKSSLQPASCPTEEGGAGEGTWALASCFAEVGVGNKVGMSRRRAVCSLCLSGKRRRNRPSLSFYALQKGGF